MKLIMIVNLPSLIGQPCPQHMWPKCSTSSTVRSIVNYKPHSYTWAEIWVVPRWDLYAVFIASTAFMHSKSLKSMHSWILYKLLIRKLLFVKKWQLLYNDQKMSKCKFICNAHTHWWYDAGGFSCAYAAQSVIWTISFLQCNQSVSMTHRVSTHFILHRGQYMVL